MGTGVGAPQHYEVTSIATDGTIQILPRGKDRPVFVNTTQVSDFIIAHATTRARVDERNGPIDRVKTTLPNGQ